MFGQWTVVTASGLEGIAPSAAIVAAVVTNASSRPDQSWEGAVLALSPRISVINVTALAPPKMRASQRGM